jgi:hypothetical protein
LFEKLSGYELPAISKQQNVDVTSNKRRKRQSESNNLKRVKKQEYSRFRKILNQIAESKTYEISDRKMSDYADYVIVMVFEEKMTENY